MDTPRTESSSASSRGSYTEEEVRGVVGAAAAHIVKTAHCLKVSEMNEMIIARDGTPSGPKPEKARQVAELYTPQEVEAHIAKRRRVNGPQWSGNLPTCSGAQQRQLDAFF